MKYSGKNFRDFYKQIVAIEMSEDIRKVIVFVNLILTHNWLNAN